MDCTITTEQPPMKSFAKKLLKPIYRELVLPAVRPTLLRLRVFWHAPLLQELQQISRKLDSLSAPNRPASESPDAVVLALLKTFQAQVSKEFITESGRRGQGRS